MTNDCQTCDETFSSEGGVRDHAWDAHSACHHCGETVDDKQTLYRHWIAIHEDELSRADQKRAVTEVGNLTVGDRLIHQGPVSAASSVRLSRRALLGGGAAAAVAGLGGAFASGLFNSSGSAASSGSAEIETGSTAPEATFTIVDGEEKQLSDYRDQKVMLWIFATWCPSCQEGARALQDNTDKLQDVEFIGVKTYGNAGYSGPSVSEFAQKYAPQLVDADNWAWGDLSEQSTGIWNPQNRPDIYFLIDKAGTIQTVSGAPAATINRITQFAQGNLGDRPGKSIEIQPAKHIQPGQSHPPHNSNPPTSGWHYPRQADWGFYSKELPDERVVHNLEHGGIWISYTGVNDSTRSQLRQLAQEYPKSVIVTQRSENDVPIAVASWGQLMELQSVDRERIVEFIEKNMNHSPEPIAGN